MNKKTKVILISSLALNIVFISFHLGHMLKKHKPGGFMRHKEKEIISVLSKENQELAKETFEKLAKIREENFEDSKEDLSEIEKIVTAKDFNQQLFLEKMNKFHGKHQEEKTASNLEIAGFLSKINQDERIKIVEQFKKSMKGFKR